MTSKKKIETFEELESFLNKHNLSIPKEWKSKFKKIKRKPKKSTEWKDCRFCHYAATRVLDCIMPLIESSSFFIENIHDDIKSEGKVKEATKDMLKSFNISSGREFIIKLFEKGLSKKGGKIQYKFPIDIESSKALKLLLASKNRKKDNEIIKKIKIKTKKETIRTILNDSHYWEIRKMFLGKPIEDMENKNLYRKEVNEFYKSVCHYIEDPKYNKDFFIYYQPDAKKFWNDYWNLYLKVR